jgi:hypothetical protein
MNVEEHIKAGDLEEALAFAQEVRKDTGLLGLVDRAEGLLCPEKEMRMRSAHYASPRPWITI